MLKQPSGTNVSKLLNNVARANNRKSTTQQVSNSLFHPKSIWDHKG